MVSDTDDVLSLSRMIREPIEKMPRQDPAPRDVVRIVQLVPSEDVKHCVASLDATAKTEPFHVMAQRVFEVPEVRDVHVIPSGDETILPLFPTAT